MEEAKFDDFMSLLFLLIIFGFGMDVKFPKNIEEKIKQYTEEHKEEIEKLSKGADK